MANINSRHYRIYGDNSFLDKVLWHNCRICNIKIANLARLYGGDGIYYTEVFIEHLRYDHNILINDYFENYANIIRPKCLCGTCDKFVDICIYGANFYWSQYACGLNSGVKKWSETAQVSRLGQNNPMFGKIPWNTGLTKETSDSLKQTGIKNRAHIIKNLNAGKYSHTITKPHKAFRDLLDELKIIYREEESLVVWSFDFFIPELNLFIEVDGDYWHSNPKLYPNGPINTTQKSIYEKDIRKNDYCDINHIHLLRFWEYDILKRPQFIKGVLCEVKKLLT